MSEFSTQTRTFLFTDIEGSTRLWEDFPEAMRSALARHDALLQEAIEEHGGHVFKTVGDAFYAAFANPANAVAAALALQQALSREAWGETGPLRVRAALHTGAAQQRSNDYFGPTLNRVARLLAIGHGGQVLLSRTTYQLVQGTLPPAASLQDMGQHRLKDLAEPEQVFQLLHPDLPAEFPPLRSLGNAVTNLPQQLTSFVGRERELAEIKSLLPRTRLLTLVGAGGCGKTRLAMQVSADVLEDYANGVWMVELAPISDPALVPQAVATALRVREAPNSTLLETLSDYLRDKSLLLVLDNCEHLVGACAQLADTLLRHCPNLRLLATSREPLNIAGELNVRVPPLALPESGRKLSLESLLTAEAARLFVERATFSQPGFSLTRQNAPAVIQICRQLDGIPLALELAAARVKALPVEQIARRLQDRFRLLTGGSRTALPHQQTLRALIDWSYELLEEKERTLLRRLSVFAGGWSLAAAEAVCTDEEIEDWEILDTLSRLVDKSLVVADERDGEARYRMLETIRQYSRDRLQETSEAEELRARHRDYFLALAEEAGPFLTGAEQSEWLARLELEHDNLRAALDWCQQHSVGTGLRLAGALHWFWEIRGYLSEGRERLAALLAHPEAEGATLARAEALHAAGRLAWHQSDYAAARALHEESLALYRELGEKAGIADALGSLGDVEYAQGNYEEARQLQEACLAIRSEMHDRYGMADTLLNLGNIALCQDDYPTARARYEESLALARKLENKRAIAFSLINLGLIAREQHDYAAAHTYYEQSLVTLRQLEDKAGTATSLHNLAEVAAQLGKHVEAAALYRESLELFLEMGNKRCIAYVLEGLSGLALAQEQPEQAVRLYAAAAALRKAIDAPLPPATQEEYDHFLADVRSALGEEVFASAWTEGSFLSLEQAIACALPPQEEANDASRAA
ncbi:MAG TPA: tetratricopeptide repeat protein [Chthonomonadaceae bacterium]|nr:tetratricopeptide repeat protein [Chthonomonadaceae bacterium]